MHPRTPTPRDSASRGSSLVEGTLVFLGLLAMLAAIVDLGQFFLFLNLVNERAHAGARYASLHKFSATAVRNYVAYNDPAPPAEVAARPGLFGLEPSMVEVSRLGAGTPEDRIEVSIRRYPLRFVTPMLFGSGGSHAWRAVIPVESLGAAQ